MDAKQRTKMLAMGLGAVVAVYSLRSTVDGFVMKPIRDLQKKLAQAEASSESLSRDKLNLQVAQRNLEDWKGISLPQDVDDAQRLYREWVYELTRLCGFSGSGFDVVPGSRSSQKEFSTVSVEVKKAETDLQGLTRFLFLFDQANMLHRISGMKIDSPGAQGNPRLVVSFTAEGMSVVGGDDKKELLPRSTLSIQATDSATQLTVAPNEAFPTWDPFEPFLIRIDRELLRVDGIEGKEWKVQREMNGTKAATHEVAAIVELLPVAWDRKDKTVEQYADFVKSSPFVIPSPPKSWNPRLAGVSDKTIKPGEEVKFTARAESFNPDLGEPKFALADAAEGMSIDAKTGEFLWKPDAKLAFGEFTATVLVTQPGIADVKLDSKLTITIKAINSPPQLKMAESAIAVIGREFTTSATATDDGPSESLKYSLGSGTPEGLSVDAKTGQLKWTPARTFSPGKYDVEIKVTDSGEEPQSVTGKINIDVQDDNASLTLLSAAIAKDDVWFAWFRNKGTGKTDRLKVGEKLTVSEITVEIVSVTNRFVTLRDAAGLWKLMLGDVLRDRKLIEPAPPVEASKVEAPVVTSTETTKSDPTATAPTATAPPATAPTATAPTATAPTATAPPATAPTATNGEPEPATEPAAEAAESEPTVPTEAEPNTGH